jgi:hypothetical protein
MAPRRGERSTPWSENFEACGLIERFPTGSLDEAPGAGEHMKRCNPCWLVLSVLELGACRMSTELVASKFVKSQLVVAAQGGTITVTRGDSPALAGTQIVIPPNALVRDTRITIGLAEVSIAPVGVRSAGPAADLGPSGTLFKVPATVSLPFSLPTGATTDQLVVSALEASGARYRIAHADLQSAGGLVSFAVSAFTVFEADVVAPPQGDGGPACSQDNASCGVDSDCCNGYCPGSDSDAGITGICSEPDAGPPDAGPGCLEDTLTCALDSDCCSLFCSGSASDAGALGVCAELPQDAGQADGGLPDAGTMDAGPLDAGPADAGPPDAGLTCLVDYSVCSFDSDCCSGLCPGVDAGVTGLCQEALCIDAGYFPEFNACDGDAGFPSCGCPFACFKDPGDGLLLCESTCNQSSDCLDPLTSCAAGSCSVNFCVADWHNNPKSGVLGQACDAQDAGSGTCIPLGTNPGGTQVGVCTQGGTATMNAPCVHFWAGPSPGFYPNPSTQADQLCAIGAVCVLLPDAGAACLGLGDGGCVVGLAPIRGGPYAANTDFYTCQSNIDCQCPAQCVIDTSSGDPNFAQVCESPCLVDADCPLAAQGCNMDAGTCSPFLCAQDGNGNSLPGTLNGSCGPNDAGNCFASGAIGICTLAGDAGLRAPCDYYGGRDNPSRLCAQGLYCAYGTVDTGARVCVGMCDPSNDAGSCSGPNEICADYTGGHETNVGECCLPTGATCTHDQACCYYCAAGTCM